MLEFNKEVKQGSVIWGGNNIYTIKSIKDHDNIILEGGITTNSEILRSMKFSYVKMMLTIIQRYEKEGYDNFITDLHYNIGLSKLTMSEFREFYKNNTSTEELRKIIKYVSFSEPNELTLTTHPLILKYLESFHLNFYVESDIKSDILSALLLGMEDKLYGDLFKEVTEPFHMYKDTKIITDSELRKLKLNKLLTNNETK